MSKAQTKFNFTRKRLETLLAPPIGGPRFVAFRDTGVKGLGLKVESSGHRTFFWSRKAKGQLEWKTLGEFESISLDEARDRAGKLNTAREKYKDPDFVGESPFSRTASPTLGELVAAYIERHVRGRAAHPEKAAANVAWQIARYATQLRERRARDIRRSEVVALHESTRAKYGIYTANRLIQTLRAAFNWGINAGLVSCVNPATGIKLFPEMKRRRFLLAPELVALRTALDSPETSADLRDFVMLALLTGARKSDILAMRWENVELDRGTWLVPNPKNKEPYYIALTVEAVRILRARLRVNEWVFPGVGRTRHLTDLKIAWKRLLARAGISELRQHDMRRTLGSWQAAGGASLPVIGKSLGHKSLGSTAIYAQLELAPVRASVEAATAAMFPEEKKLLPAAARRRRV